MGLFDYDSKAMIFPVSCDSLMFQNRNDGTEINDIHILLWHLKHISEGKFNHIELRPIIWRWALETLEMH